MNLIAVMDLYSISSPQGSQRMKAYDSIELQLDPQQLPIIIPLPCTPPKQHSSLDSLNSIGFQQHMMLVQTPIKEQPKLIDSLLLFEHPNYQQCNRESSSMMQEELAQDIFGDCEQEDLENREPNINKPKFKSNNHPKPLVKTQEEGEVSNQTFKTPGRSQRSHNLSATNKKRPCTCKKSGCLKKYCECFKAGEICNQNCDCIGCKNNDPAHLKAITQSSSKTAQQIMCNCKRSNCLKGYCDCHTAGVMCSSLCNCLGCKNTVPTPSQFAFTHTSKRSKKVHWSQIDEEMEEEPNQL